MILCNDSLIFYMIGIPRSITVTAFRYTVSDNRNKDSQDREKQETLTHTCNKTIFIL